jgi:hypothetical protein
VTVPTTKQLAGARAKARTRYSKYFAEFTVGCQTFRIAEVDFKDGGTDEQEAKKHCEFIARMFNIALTKVVDANVQLATSRMLETVVSIKATKKKARKQ